MQDTAQRLKEQLEGMRSYESYENKVNAVEQERNRLQQEVTKLEQSCIKEDRDVERLEKGGLQAFYFKVRGKYEEQMDKEVLEAAAAKVKLKNKRFELDDAERRLNGLLLERSKYANCQSEYNRLYQKRMEEILEEDNSSKIRILELQTKLQNCEHNRKEIREALSAGNQVLGALENVDGSLDSASGWATWDILGGGMMSDMMKHSNLDDAKDELENVQRLMGSFRTELADVHMILDIQIQTDGFAKFADFFWDGLFADMNMKSRIEDAQESVENAKNDVRNVLHRLSILDQKEEEKIETYQLQIAEIVNQ